MTVFDASLSLFEWFKQNEYFCIKENFVSVCPISLEKEKDQAAIEAALHDMVSAEMLVESETEQGKIWILKRKLDQLNQNVELTYSTTSEVALIVNSFCEVVGMGQYTCDPTEIKEQDIKSLCFIAQTLASEKNIDEDGDE